MKHTKRAMRALSIVMLFVGTSMVVMASAGFIVWSDQTTITVEKKLLVTDDIPTIMDIVASDSPQSFSYTIDVTNPNDHAVTATLAFAVTGSDITASSDIPLTQSVPTGAGITYTVTVTIGTDAVSGIVDYTITQGQ